MPGDSGVLVVSRVRSTTTKGTREHGCSGHPAFATPSKGREINAQRGRIAPRGREAVSGIRATSLRAKRSNPFFLLRGKHGLLRFARNDGLERANTLSRRRPRKRAIQYSEAPMMESRCRHSSCPGLTRASIHLRKIIFEEDGLPGIGERKRRRPSDGYARQ